ncbi:MAG: Uma2 family endonuclease [Chloroflexia bacterium]|nr:Uma2 family endonuclease [Chloroflexia bacterium]
MSTVARLLTYDDLRRMPDDGKRYEIIGGELIVSPSPIRAHQEFSIDLIFVVDSYVRQHHLGRVYHAPVDVRLSPHDVVQPDLLFIREDRLDIYKARGDVQGPPDLVVEIISPSSEKTDPGRKFELYAASGVPEYWLADPATRRFQLFVLRQGRYNEVAAVAGRVASTVIAGLVLDPAELFAGIDQATLS